jgi:hypothetical protein
MSIKELLNEKLNIRESVHQKDDLLSGITFEDLIIAVESNEKEINKSTITKVYNELLKANMKDAQFELNKNMDWIIKKIR